MRVEHGHAHDLQLENRQGNASSGEFTPAEGVEVDEAYIDGINAIVRNKVVCCRGVQWYNYSNDISKALGLEQN